MTTHNSRKCPKISRGRSALAVDLENISRSGDLKESDADAWWWTLDMLFPKSAELSFVAVNPRNALAGSRFAQLANGALRCRSGKNGADLAIIEFLDEVGAINTRFPAQPITHLRLVSGDGIYVNSIRKLRLQGVHITLVGHRDSVHHKLHRVANRIVFLDDFVPKSLAA
jgi:hypothetical protein